MRVSRRFIARLAIALGLIGANMLVGVERAEAAKAGGAQHCHWYCGSSGYFEGCAAGGSLCGETSCGDQPTEVCN